MKISIISFTAKGSQKCREVHKKLEKEGYEVISFGIEAYAANYELEPLTEPLIEWTKRQFAEREGILFIGASGIAVRAIAPFLKDKIQDPAVIVMDEMGRFVIPLLSGHIGGANELALNIAHMTGGTPVITTATDINKKFAVDMFAKKNHLFVSRMDYAKEISAAILNGSSVGFQTDFPIKGRLPVEITLEGNCEYGIMVSFNEKKKPFKKTLNLVPKIMTLGIGCRKGKAFLEINNEVEKVLKGLGSSIHGVKNVATIDLKEDEKGLKEFCETYKLELLIYSAADLEKVPGHFTESEYVKKVTGVGNVCERAAFLGSGGGILIQNKVSGNGVTVSVAIKDWSVNFE